MGLFGNNETVTTTFVGKDNLSPVVRGIRSTMDQFRRDARGGFGLAAGFSVFNAAKSIIGGAVDVMGDAIGAASDLAEANSKVGVVFGDQADEIRKWATSAATNIGTTERAALSAVGTMGNLLKGTGLTGDALRDMSEDVVQLAADLGSFNNVNTDEVLLALQSGLNGEAEPMRRFGVLLNEAKVKAEGMAMGLADATGNLSEGARVQARYSLILKETKDAQGDFARTSGGAANQQRILNARLGDLQAKLGQILIGPATDFLGFLTDVVGQISGGSGAVNSVNQLTEAFKRQATVVEEVAQQGEGAVQTFDALGLLGALFSESKFALGGERLANIANQLREVGTAAGLTEGQLRELVTNTFGNLTDDKVPEALERMRRVMSNFASERNAFILSSGDRTGNPLANLTPPPGAEKRLREIAVALGFVARNAGDADGNFKDLRSRFRELMKGGDDNQRAIRRLSREIKIWDRAYRQAVLNGNSGAAAYAKAQADAARAERRQRRLTKNTIDDERSALLQARKEAQRKKEVAIAAAEEEKRKQRLLAEAIARGKRLIRESRREAEKFNTLPDAYWTAHLNFNVSGLGFLGGLPIPQSLLPIIEDVMKKRRGKRNGPGPGRASGGPVSAGQAYTVGERGPETLVMGNQSGHIIPNGGGRDINLYIDGERMFRWFMRREAREAYLSPTG